ncbi:hypothetical protein, partial [Lactococcus petauri]|uniref:hypothetical protein n=1 Tax=Lactococcus petauri TaxID=1940789 RepID=UPI0021F0CB31
MADQFLQTLTQEAQAQYEAQERKKQIAQMMMKQSGGGLQAIQVGDRVARVHPLAHLANFATQMMSQKNLEKASEEQGKLRTEGA